MSEFKEKKKKMSLFTKVIIGFLIFLMFGVIGAVSSINGTSEKNISEKEEFSPIIVDVNQFAKISSEELIKIFGEPTEKEKINYSSPNGKKYKTTYYRYNKEGYCFEFLLIDNKVVRFNLITDYFETKEPIKYKNEKDIFNMFGISPNENLSKIADTGSALRYSPVSDKVGEVWIPMIENQSMNLIKITFDLNYF